MEEKKKKQRPTVAQVNEMEEVISRQVKELDAWRESYRVLSKKNKKLLEEMHELKARGFWARLFNIQ